MYATSLNLFRDCNIFKEIEVHLLAIILPLLKQTMYINKENNLANSSLDCEPSVALFNLANLPLLSKSKMAAIAFARPKITPALLARKPTSRKHFSNVISLEDKWQVFDIALGYI